MRHAIAVAVSVVLLSGCAQEQAEDTAPEGSVAALTIADFVGTWNGISTLPGAEPVPSAITVGTDGSATLLLDDRDPVPTQLSISGDSLVSTTAEYESVLRPGVKVTVRTASVRIADSLSGSLVATYRTATGEEVVHGTYLATRVP